MFFKQFSTPFFQCLSKIGVQKNTTNLMLIFGYGSLIWKPNFPYEKRIVGYVRYYIRRFWQGSNDHRGTEDQPGRVVTLIKTECANDVVWGVVYEVDSKERESVLSYLNMREKNGYELVTMTFIEEGTSQEFCVQTYVANNTNTHFLGPAPKEEIAKTILRAEGNSGKNIDYLYMLYNALINLSNEVKVEQHISELMHEVSLLLAPKQA